MQRRNENNPHTTHKKRIFNINRKRLQCNPQCLEKAAYKHPNLYYGCSQTANPFMPLHSAVMGCHGHSTWKHALTDPFPDVLMHLHNDIKEHFCSFLKANQNSNQNPNQCLPHAFDKNHNSQKTGSLNPNQIWIFYHLKNKFFTLFYILLIILIYKVVPATIQAQVLMGLIEQRKRSSQKKKGEYYKGIILNTSLKSSSHK